MVIVPPGLVTTNMTLQASIIFQFKSKLGVGESQMGVKLGLALDVEALVDRSFSEIDALVAFLKSLSGEPLQIEPPKLP